MATRRISLIHVTTEDSFKGGWKEKKDALLAELEADKEGTGDPLCRK